MRGPLPAVLLLWAVAAAAETEIGHRPPGGDAATRAGRPAPDVAGERYGPHRRNVLDLWKAASDGPTPLVIFIHGGGFRMGSKQQVSAELVKQCLAERISVASISYRLSGEAPFPAPMHDSARAVQYLRSRAREWNIDPDRIGATGPSAGAGISLWLAFHDDLADAKNQDPVLRESTRIACAAGERAQTSYDPRFMKEFIGRRVHEHPALPPFWGLEPDEMETEKAHRIFEESSPIHHLTRGDPPVLLLYAGRIPTGDAGGDIHTPKFGAVLKERMDKLGLACGLVTEPYGTDVIVKFFVEHLAKQPARTEPPDDIRGK